MALERIRVVQCGLGFAGTTLVRGMLAKKSVVCVGAVDKCVGIGQDLGDLLGGGVKTGVIVSKDVDAVLKQTQPDVWIEATQSTIRGIFPRVMSAVEAGANVITLAEEFADPWKLEPELTRQIDESAKRNNVTVIGTGFNPGLWLDVWPFFLSGCAFDILKITINYMSDLSPYGRSPDVIKNYGFGLDPDQVVLNFESNRGKSNTGTTGIIQNLARCLGFQLSDCKERIRPLISTIKQDFSPAVVIEPGQVHGLMVEAYGAVGDRRVIEIYKGACCKPKLEMKDFGDGPHTEAVVRIEGEPEISSRLSLKSTRGWSTTAPRLLNWIPYAVKARPGLLTDLREFPLIGIIS